MTTKFSFHDKKVTLQLARLSTAADENQDFADALNKLPSLNFDVYALEQTDQEILFAEFDDEMEVRIKSEFEADASFVIDLGHANGVCTLCGHIGCRYIFRITNTVNQKIIECGSECIITHGLCVKGAETAEHARKALETTIRRHIRRLKIEAWHTDMGFSESMFGTLSEGLYAISRSTELIYSTRNSARCKARYDLPKLKKFYDRNGWLNTEKRWAEWTRLVKFARQFNPNTKHSLSYPKPFGFKDGEMVQCQVAAEMAPELEETMESIAQDEAEPVITEEMTQDLPVQTLPQSVPTDSTFDSMTRDLVFG